MNHHNLSNTASRACLIALTLCLTACKAPPSVGPFVDGTIQLRAAVLSAGVTVADELRASPDSENFAARLEEQWLARDQAMQALTVYAASLQSIVSSGHGGAQAASNVADALGRLAGSVGIVPAADEAVSLATDAARFVYQQIALVRASKSLERAMIQAQPAIEEIARLLQEDFADLLVIFRSANRLAEVELAGEYGDLLAYREDLAAAVAAADIPALDAPAIENLGRLSALLADTTTWYVQYLAKESALRGREHLGRQLIAAAAQSSRQWAAAHQQIVVALRDGRAVDARSLLLAAVEIRQLVQRAREL